MVQVAAENILGEVNPLKAINTQVWNYECNGSNMGANAVAVSGLVNMAMAVNSTLRFGIEIAPDASQRKGIVMRTASTDLYTNGAPRCEIALDRGTNGYLPKAQTFWVATNLWLDDWTTTADEQLVAQFHDSDFSQSMQPYLALYVKGNKVRMSVRWDSSGLPTTKATPKGNKDIWVGNFDFSKRWVNLIIQARSSTTTTDHPFVKVWFNGALVANYAGPVGYNQPAFKNYAKLGYYHWIDSTNPWDPKVPTRLMYVGKSNIVKDPNGLYDDASLRALISSN